MRTVLLLALAAGVTLAAAQSAKAGDLRHDLVGCWDKQLSRGEKADLAKIPGSIADSMICFKRNGETTAQATVGGGQVGRMLFELEGVDGAGSYYFSNGRLIINGLYDFDTDGPLSCVAQMPSPDRLELTDCINGFFKDFSIAPSRSYLREKKQ
jgi:hypothetical protein